MASWMDDVCHPDVRPSTRAAEVAQLTALFAPVDGPGSLAPSEARQKSMRRITYLEHAQSLRQARIEKLKALVDRLEQRVDRPSMFGRPRGGRSARQDQLGPAQKHTIVAQLEHSAVIFEGHESTKWTSLSVSDAGTLAMTTAGGIYWWGLIPPPIRQKAAEAAVAASPTPPGPQLELHPSHSHPLLLSDRQSGWRCDVCSRGGSGSRRYRCTRGCDYDVCGSCRDKTRRGSLSDRSSSSAKRSSSVPLTFETAYTQYLTTFSDNPSQAYSKTELASLLAGDKYRSHLIKDLDRDGHRYNALAAMHRLYHEVADSLQSGDIVGLQTDGNVVQYAAGATALSMDGNAEQLTLAQNLTDDQSSLDVMFTNPSGQTVVRSLAEVIIISPEQSRPRARVINVERSRGIAVIQRLPANSSRDASDSRGWRSRPDEGTGDIVDLWSLSTSQQMAQTQPSSRVTELVQTTPLNILPIDRVGFDFSVAGATVCGWTVMSSLVSKEKWDRAVSEEIVHRYVADLRQGIWQLNAARCRTAQAVQHNIVGTDDTGSSMLELDEAGRVCLPSNCSLPPFEFIGTGPIAALDSDKPRDVQLVVCGFRSSQMLTRTRSGCSGRNALHDSVLVGGNIEEAFSCGLGRGLADMLAEYDWCGSTPFYIAMQRGDLQSACALRAKAIECDCVEGALLRPNIHGIPPVHALLGLTDQRNASMPRHETPENVEQLSQELFSGPEGNRLLTTRTQGGESVLDTFIRGDMRTTASPEIIKLLANHPRAIQMCFQDKHFDMLKPHAVDELLLRLVTCKDAGMMCRSFAACMARLHNTEDSELRIFHVLATSFIQSAVRIYIALYSGAKVSGVKPTQSTAMKLHLMSIFRILSPLAIRSLIGQADRVLTGVRLGLPQRALPAVSVAQVQKHALSAGAIGQSRRGWMKEIVGAQCSEPPQASGSSTTPAGQLGSFSLADFPIGSKVMVLSPTQNWRPCVVIAHEDAEEDGGEECDAAIQVHYETFDDEHDEWIGLESDFSRLKAPTPKPSAMRGDSSSSASASSAPQEEGDVPAAGPSSLTTDIGGNDPKVLRARIFHLCVSTAASLGSQRLVDRRELSAEAPQLSESDEAMLAVAQMLQASWEWAWDICDACEEGLQLAAQQVEPTGSEPATGDSLDSAASDVFGDLMRSAAGLGEAKPSIQDYVYVAFVLDALVCFKQCLSEVPSKHAQLRADSLKRANSTAVQAKQVAVSIVPEDTELVRALSVMQKPANADSMVDALSEETKMGLLRNLKIPVGGNGGSGDHVALSGDAAAGQEQGPIDGRLLTEYPLLKALYRWRKTLEMLAEAPIPDSCFQLLAPFEVKEQRFRKRMSDAVQAIPRPSKPSEKEHKLCLLARRGSSFLSNAMANLAKEKTLVLRLEDKEPWFVDERGEGKGVIREYVNIFVHEIMRTGQVLPVKWAIAANERHSAGQPPVAVPPGWWNDDPMCRCVLCPEADYVEPEPEPEPELEPEPEPPPPPEDRDESVEPEPELAAEARTGDGDGDGDGESESESGSDVDEQDDSEDEVEEEERDGTAADDVLPATAIARGLDASKMGSTITLDTTDGSEVKLVAQSKKAEAVVRLTTPFSKETDGPIGYFELRITKGNVVAAGVCTANHDCKVSGMLGQGKLASCSYGLGSVDGRLHPPAARLAGDGATAEGIAGADAEAKRSSAFRDGDVVGCGYVFATNTLFWTVNGKLRCCADATNAAGSTVYYGAVSLARSSAVHLNVGSSPFVFDLSTLPRERVDLQYSLWLSKLRRLGNILGLCLLHGGDQFELRSPLYFARHVYKFIIGRPITFADYAYYNPDAHASLSKFCRDGASVSVH